MEWPGWSRSAKTEDEALAGLVAHGDRYAAVARQAGITFTPPRDASELRVTEQLDGSGSTDFGIPSLPAAADARPIDARAAKRLQALLEAAWATFDEAVRAAHGLELRTGPRGGGRTRTKIVGHVLEAEAAYLHQLGSRAHALPSNVDERMAAIRRTELDAFTVLARGEPLPEPNRVRKPWHPRYFVRRSAWHALDHAWEIEDRAIRV